MFSYQTRSLLLDYSIQNLCLKYNFNFCIQHTLSDSNNINNNNENKQMCYGLILYSN